MRLLAAMGSGATLLALLFDCGNPTQPVGIFKLAPSPAGFTLTSPDGTVLLQSYAKGSGAYGSLAVRRASENFQMAFGSFDITEGGQPWSAASKFQLSRHGGNVAGTWTDSAGTMLATLSATSPQNGILVLTVDAADAAMNQVSLAFDCGASDHFLGFGEQSDAIDHYGHKVPIWTSEHGIGKASSDDPPADWFIQGARHSSNMGLPTWLSQRGYIGAVESPRRSIFELCSVQSDAFRIEGWSNEIKLWLFYGPDPATALQLAAANLYGLPVRPPPLAFAPWNDAIFGADNVRRISGIIRDAGFPSSVIWTEDFRGGQDVSGQGYRLTENWDIDPTLYPDAGQLAADLHNAGFAWLAYFNTFIVQGSDVWGEAQDGGHFVQSPDGGAYLFAGESFDTTGMADLSSPQAAEWVKSHMRAALDIGFDGWMADYGEWLPADSVLASGEDPREAHNLYPLDWARLNAEVLAERAGDGRQRLFFARSGWYGTPSVVPVFWPADQRTDFETDDGMPTVVPMALGLGLAGVSTFGSDIAGYQSISNPTSTKELFFRWTELGALSPVMRTHHGLFARQNWWFGEDAETLAHFSRWARFHMQLYPYLDGASAFAESKGIPLMRALVLPFPDDPSSWTIDDEYLLGPSLLVAPVMTQGATSRSLHLPQGHWFPLGGGTPQDGPADITVQAPVTEIPVFVPAGAVIPALPDGVQTVLPAGAGITTLDQMSNNREIWLFAGAAGGFVERDGTTYTLSMSTTPYPPGFVDQGTTLAECTSPAERGCLDSTQTPVRVRMADLGPLTFGNQMLMITGPQRTIDVLVTQ